MIPPSTKELLKIADSKYAVVVAVAKRARDLSEKNRNDENFRVSSMVTESLEDIYNGKIHIRYQEIPDKEAAND